MAPPCAACSPSASTAMVLWPKTFNFPSAVGLLVQLPPLGGRGDRVKDSCVGDASLSMIRNQLIAVGSYADSGVTGLLTHGPSKQKVMLAVPCRERKALSKGLER